MPAEKRPFLSVLEAAKRRRCTERRIRQYIEEGKLPAVKIGRDWLIAVADLDALPDYHPGRPPKPDGDE